MPQVVSIFDVGDYEAEISRGAASLSAGGIVVLPTETVYGAAGLLSNPKSNARLRSIRNAGGSKPFTVHLARPDDALKYIAEPSDLGKRMIRKLWPGPVALVFEVPQERRIEVMKEIGVSQGDIYDGSLITLRCPDHTVATDILSEVDGPVALTLVDYTDWKSLDGKAELVYDAGPARQSKPSTIVRVYDDRYEIVREGVYDQRIIERLLRTTILFVCSGNTCRSPMAEGMARKLISQKLGVGPDDLEKKGIIVMSAGSFAMPGARATPQAVEALKNLGGDLTRHRSRPLTVELIHQADQIFTMGRSHAAAVRSLVPSASEKTATLDPDGDIEDPIGGDLALYQSLAKELGRLIEKQVLPGINS